MANKYDGEFFSTKRAKNKNCVQFKSGLPLNTQQVVLIYT